MSEKRLTKREQAFVREYCVDMNGTQAATRAGYSAKTAGQAANRLLRNVQILTAIQAATKARFDRLEINADDLIKRAATIIRTDTRKLMGVHIGACRYCHGDSHQYQWRTPREFSDAVEAYMAKGELYHAVHSEPNNEGGYGYRKTARPHPGCIECDGLGVPYTQYTDTRDLSADEALLFEGFKETRDGLQITLASKQAAFETLAKHYGILKEKIEHTGKDGKPIQHEVTTRVVIVPAKVPSPTSTRPMAEDDAE